ncbi:glycerol uptake operon antiterminator regulatory protein [Paenibacillus baekrokdamisoli]|uniref:Glycerol uptake operon antiterminator regulatory protein n=1 Tax=Paenibacillus baekrokdamisoli TaxID=1712516 RepID=A0A3G9JFM2_9BACL|nr:glycerol-3-phosphate responsive antiterminator [Paenibacillus baekrokdamisoli]MBB3071733.1 glycerol uptake operon antiterminator [Paenibacillus baekrokdamisoli]BBH21759.1 glycerol uptake operon antiterminator regulatory protein [Paenibacillus baekrokdamisoli]
MAFHNQLILPAARKMKDLENLMTTSYEYIVLLDSHISQIKPILDIARGYGKKVLLHADLIEGLKNDEYAAEYLCQVMKPAGLISTRASVISKTKQNGLLAIQRMFLLDTNALEKSHALLERSRPDYIEVLPGVMPHIIAEVHERTGIPIFAGGLIRSVSDVEQALSAGATAVTTSKAELWKHYEQNQ